MFWIRLKALKWISRCGMNNAQTKVYDYNQWPPAF